MNTFVKRIGTLILFSCSIFASSVQAVPNKVVSITGDAAYSGTYVYQGTRNGYSYYELSSTKYLYVDNYLGSWQAWVIGTLKSNPTGSDVTYYQYPLSSNPGDPTWYETLHNGVVTVSITDESSGTVPTVSTSEASLVTTTSGTMNGNIISDGGATADRGFAYSSSDNTPTVGEGGVTQLTEGTGTGTFSGLVGSLTPGTTYYYQAYGHNGNGYGYGGVKSFATPMSSQPNKLVSDITSPSAANGVYVWIGNYYGKPAWKHQTQNYWVYYSRYSALYPTTYYWFIDDELKDDHSAVDYAFYHADAAICPASGWVAQGGTGTVAIADYPQITFTNGSAYSPGNVNANSNNNIIGRFFLQADIAGASLTAVTISAAGTRTGVNNLKLWSSTDNSFNSGSDTQLNIQSNGSSVTFSGFSSSISTSETYYFVTADLASTATGTFTLTIASKASLTISGGAIASDFTNAALTSGTINIISLPTVSTTAASGVSLTSATLGGNVTADGGASVSERGVVYSSADATPTIGEGGVTKDVNGSGTGIFSKSVGSLARGTHYYFQAYATNSIGTSYSGYRSSPRLLLK